MKKLSSLISERILENQINMVTENGVYANWKEIKKFKNNEIMSIDIDVFSDPKVQEVYAFYKGRSGKILFERIIHNQQHDTYHMIGGATKGSIITITPSDVNKAFQKYKNFFTKNGYGEIVLMG